MITDITDLENGSTERGDVCVVGTGPAGAEAIRFLRRHGLKVVVAEGGRRDFSKTAQELTRSENVGRPVREPDPTTKLTPYLAPELRNEGRLRQFGGNSNIWTGKWREFEPLDFAVREHVPESRWPLSYEELLPIYREIEAEYGFGDFATVAESHGYRPFLEATRGSGIETTFHYWSDKPLRVPESFGQEFAEDPHLTLVTGANAVELIQGDRDDTVRRLRCRSLEGREIFIEARHYVLAMGGIETPRLMLASDGKYAEGVANGNGLVGRYFMEHPKLKAGVFWPGPAFDHLPEGAADWPRPRFKQTFSLSEDLQMKHGLLNHGVHVSPMPGGLRERVRKLMSQSSYAAALGEVTGARIARRGAEPHRLSIIVEQAPNPDSRVSLSSERDALGMRKSRLDWRLNDLDRSSFGATVRLLSEKLEDSGIGRIDFGRTKPGLDDTIDCRHHMGTTRMAATEAEGVVDRDCRAFGAANLFIAGGAVFPTGHSFGPTLTIVALTRHACRAILNDHGCLSAVA